MGRSMGLDFGLEEGQWKFCKRKFRWLLKIEEVCGTKSGGAKVLPPLKSARPSLTFREMEARHLNEHVFYPAKPEWAPISLVLFDLKKDKHPVFDWIKKAYDPKKGDWFPSAQNNFIKHADLELYDGCGNLVETWVYEEVWPQVIEFGELDMGASELVTCDLKLRYARAYVED